MAYASFGNNNSWQTLVNHNGNEFDLGNELQDLQKIKKQYSALHNLLIQKGILTEDEIKEYINSLNVVEILSKD